MPGTAAAAEEQAGGSGEAGPSKPSASKKRKAGGSGEGVDEFGQIVEGLSGAPQGWGGRAGLAGVEVGEGAGSAARHTA